MNKFEKLLIDSKYNEEKRHFVNGGFRGGFFISYDGPIERQQTAGNLSLTCGSAEDLWNKVMKEVKLLRFAGPFDSILYKVQSVLWRSRMVTHI